MRIAQVPPLAESVPPKLYGGTERVVSWLTEELVALGHDVTLFGTADSTTRGRLVPVWPRALRLSRPKADPLAAHTVLLEAVAQQASEFDVIHCHLDWMHLPLFGRLAVPFVTTLHGRLDMPGFSTAAARFPGAPFVSISNDQRLPLPQANWLSTVYHGMPPGALRPSFDSGNYLAFLGRIAPEKGPDVAIEIARGAAMQLRIAAKIPRAEARYFKERLEPKIDGSQIQLVGEVNDRKKESFLRAAAALLFPIDWPEPFGLVMIEAMACGTPVIAFRRGSVSEIIEDGVTGFIVESQADAVRAVARLGELDRRRIRNAFEERFAARRMAEDYLKCYGLLSANARRPSTLDGAPFRPYEVPQQGRPGDLRL
jgi:glycosyltransferase involved in cell wall biosynthesis